MTGGKRKGPFGYLRSNVAFDRLPDLLDDTCMPFIDHPLHKCYHVCFT